MFRLITVNGASFELREFDSLEEVERYMDPPNVNLGYEHREELTESLDTTGVYSCQPAPGAAVIIQQIDEVL